MNMDYSLMKSIIEGLLFVVGDEGIDVNQIAEVLEVAPEEIRKLMPKIQASYLSEQRGMQLVELAGTYQLTTIPAHAPYFQRLARSPSRGTLSQAALETLSIIAYRQPITRIDIEEIRGVKSDRALHTLVAKELIYEVARAEAVGRPILYGTTKLFLDHFGLNDLKELPESVTFENNDNLEEETKLLFARLENEQMTIDDVE